MTTTTYELKARFTQGPEMGESTDYEQIISDHKQVISDHEQVISDHNYKWTNNSGCGGCAHPWRVGSWYVYLRVDGVSSATSVVFLLREPSCKCNSIILQAQSTKALSLCELEKVVNSCWQKASCLTYALLVVFLPCLLFSVNPV